MIILHERLSAILEQEPLLLIFFQKNSDNFARKINRLVAISDEIDSFLGQKRRIFSNLDNAILGRLLVRERLKGS